MFEFNQIWYHNIRTPTMTSLPPTQNRTISMGNTQTKKVMEPPPKKQKTRHKDPLPRFDDTYHCEPVWMNYEKEEPELYHLWQDGLTAHAESFLTEADLGLARFYCILEPDRMKVVDSKNNGYCWSDDTLLWEKKSVNHIRNVIMHRLNGIFGTHLTYLTDEKNNEQNCRDGECKCCNHTQEKCDNCKCCKEKVIQKEKFDIKILNATKLLKKVSSWKEMHGVTENVCFTFFDDNFEDIVNKASTELPLSNGSVIDLKSLTTRERTRGDYWSYELDVTYIPEVGQPSDTALNPVKTPETPKAFIHAMMLAFCNGNEELLDYLQRICGVMLTREALSLKKLFIFYGKGNNGKTTCLFDPIQKVLKQNFVPISSGVLLAGMQPKPGRATPQLMELPNARAIVTSDADFDKNTKLSDNIIKPLTGGDPIKIRQLHSKEIEFRNRALICIPTNHRPSIKNIHDEAMVGRLAFIPCDATFVKNDANNKKVARMLLPNELNAFFSWMATGANAFLTTGSLGKVPPVAQDANDLFIKEQDTASQWIEDACTVGKKSEGASTIQSEVYPHYKQWCADEEFTLMEKRTFLKQLKNLESTYDFEMKKSGVKKLFRFKIDSKVPGVLYQTPFNQ